MLYMGSNVVKTDLLVFTAFALFQTLECPLPTKESLILVARMLYACLDKALFSSYESLILVSTMPYFYSYNKAF
jgi:hypothetical protein